MARVVAFEPRSSVDELLRSAIARKRLVKFTYKGAERIAEPHDYGVHNGIVRLLVFQLRRAGNPRERGWRMLDVEKIEQLVLLDTTFPGSRSKSHDHHFAWDVVFARVE